MSIQRPTRIAPFLTAADVALQLNTTLRHVYRLIHRKREPLPAHWVGAYLRIDPEELLDWVCRERKLGKAVRHDA